MRQVIFFLPGGIPIHGFGLMLFLAFVICTWVGGRRAVKAGMPREIIQDLAVWLFFGGIVGARLASVLLEGVPLSQIYRIWDGGLVFYGSAIGALVAYGVGYFWMFRKRGISTWKLADVVAPCVAIGLSLGRFGCFLNGCCYGTVAEGAHCPTVAFPLSGPPRFGLYERGVEDAGFLIQRGHPGAPPVVSAVTANSPAAASGLQAGDAIIQADAQPISDAASLEDYLLRNWPRGKNDLTLTVRRDGQEWTLPAFAPRTLGLHPTQLYESISMLLACAVLLAYEPFKRRPGELIALLMIAYGLHRYFNEMIRDDARPVGFEKYMSVFLIATGAILFWWRRQGRVVSGQ